MTELVPNTPSQPDQASTQRSFIESADRSYGDSYLHDMLQGPINATQSSSPAPARPTQPLVSSPSGALDDIEDPDISRVPESQQSPQAHSPPQERRHSLSQPNFEVSGNLGETQVQSLGRDISFAPYRFRQEGSKAPSNKEHEQEHSAAGDGDTTAGGEQSRVEEEEDGELSMDLTRAAGGIQAGEEDVSMVESEGDRSGALEPVEEVNQAGKLGADIDSRKENSPSNPSAPTQPEPSAASPAPAPAPLPPLAPRSSRLNVDSGTTGPSSSPAVAMNLLQGRLSPNKRAFQALNNAAPTPSVTTEPASSGDFTGSFLLPEARPEQSTDHSDSRSKSMPELSQDTFGPETSTPAFPGAPLPLPPLTAARTLPDFSRIAKPRKGTAVYQSSDAMAKVAVKTRKKKSEWDTSQETPESLEQSRVGAGAGEDPAGDEEEEEDLPETEVAEESYGAATDDGGGEQSMDIDETVRDEEQMSMDESRVETPRRSAPMEIARTTPATELAAPSAKDEETQESVATSHAFSAPPAHQISPRAASSDADSSIPRLARPFQETPLFGPNLDSSQSQSQSIIGDLDESLGSQRHSMNLTDIGLLSSQADQTQIEVEPTQVEYDIERLPPISGDLSIGSSTRGFSALRNETLGSTISNAHSVPRPGRELRRVPPPPSPVYNAAAIARPPALEASSPDVPLPPTALASAVASSSSRLRPEEQSSSPALNGDSAPSNAASPSLQLSAPSEPHQSSSRAEKPHSISSNGVVPDSEGPTQTSSPQKTTTRPSPSTSKATPRRETLADDVMDIDEVPQPLDSAQGDHRQENLRAPSPAPLAGQEADRNAKAPETAEGKRRKTATSPRKLTPKRNKGKGRAVEPSQDSPDELDLFQPTQPRADAQRPSNDEIDESEPLMETNYDDPPGVNDSKRLSPKKNRPLAASPAAPSVASPARARKRRISEPVIEVEIPAKRRRNASKDDSKAVEAKAPSRVKAKTKTTAGGKKRGKARKATTPPTSSDDEGHLEGGEDEEEQAGPVAGPSRLRFTSVDEVMPDVSRHSVASSEQGGNKSTTSGAKIKLPSAAPFTRIFGLWRDDGWLYPGTIVGVVSGHVKVIFDDESKGKLKFSEIRRCELKRGDYIRYRGDEIDTETQAAVLHRDVRVYRVERGEEGVDVEGILEPTDVVVVSKEELALEQQPEESRRDRLQRLELAAITIAPEHAAQLDDRKPSPADIVAFEGRPQKPIKALSLLKIPAAPALEPIASNKKIGLFSRMAFLLTNTPAKGTDAEKTAFLSLLHEHGATVIDLGHLFTARAGDKEGEATLEFSRNATVKNIDTILLLADRPCTTSKYLVALALGIPCISSRFIESSIHDGARLEWKDFALTSGFLQSLGTYAVGAQIRSIAKPTFDLDSLSTLHAEGGIFSGRSVLVVSKKGKGSSDHIRSLLSILAAAGATTVHFVASPEAASSAAGYDHVVLDDSLKKTTAMAGHSGVGNMTWLKQCLIAGRLLPSAMMKVVEE
ncbi:hypothetical protein BCR35DRAFT_309384 [Leucosporidium creatinivorum]|uniref:BRCT domain-containing protein n=1 Tax=Leucosporidium creatinivorum TaxID=106004 RepID=A0A1Y2DHC6_9BASI|nr:hypothetical protein BCR35DRAFT_309384 [Leucosporidium creatinivorum]